MQVILRHAESGGAALLSTHDRVAAEEACHRLVVLHEGSAVASGTPHALLADDSRASLRGLLERVGATEAASGG